MTLCDELNVIIIGAGPAGLLVGQGLKKHGIKCTIFERELASVYQTCPADCAMTLPWGSPSLARCVPTDLLTGIDEAMCCDPWSKTGNVRYLPCYNGKTGKKLFDILGTEPRRVSRRKMTNYLSQGLDIQCGRWLSSVSSDPSGVVTAHFYGGTSMTCHLLIGCDGANSTTRKALVGKDLAEGRDIGLNVMDITGRLRTKTALSLRLDHAASRCAYHPNGYVWRTSILDVPKPDQPGTWLFQHSFSWRGHPGNFPNQRSRLDWWQFQARQFAEPWRTIGKEMQLQEGKQLRGNRVGIWTPTIDWSKRSLSGLVVLVGDAGRSMPPHNDRGLINALEDAAMLVEQLVAVKAGGKTVIEATDTYQRAMEERSEREIEIAVKTAEVSHSFKLLAELQAM